jgi:ACS family hexuronate transporter-like MFS transporter
VGTKLGFALALLIWSGAAIAHAFVATFGPAVAAVLATFGLTYSGSVAGFMAARFALGIGEAGNFPAAIKTVAEWFPKSERALSTGIFNSGTNIGALLTPLIVPWITYTYGWKWAFVATGALGLLWLAVWWPLYGAPVGHPRVGAAELAIIQSDPPDPPVQISWLSLVSYRQTWAVAAAKFGTDPVWWLYLFWIPDFLHRRHGIDLQSMALPLVAIYLIADVGSIAGGWLSSALLKRGWTANAARKTAMLACALAVTPIGLAANVGSEWLAVVLVGIAAAAHQGWSANVYTLASDMFPRQAVGSVIGFAGMCGAVGGMLIAKITGYVLEATGSYVVIFLMAASAYLVTLLVVHLLVPRLAPVRLDARPHAS